MSKLWTFGDSFTAGHGCKFFLHTTPKTTYYKTYQNYIDDNKKIWPEIVSSFFKLELNNEGRNGITNEKILDYLLKNYSKIKNGDYVIIQTSTSARYDFPFLKNKTLFGVTTNDTEDLYEIKSPYRFKTVFLSNVENEYENINPALLTYSNLEEDIDNEKLILTKEKYETIRNFFLEFVHTKKHYEREIWRLVQIAYNLKENGVNVFILNEDTWPDYVEKPNFLIDTTYHSLLSYVINTKNTITYESNNRIKDDHPSYRGHMDIANIIIKHIESTNLYNT
jgi:hypothetical protein